MSQNDEWQKRHNQELARKQREYEEAEARKRRQKERDEQDARSKKALRDAHARAAEQSKGYSTAKPAGGGCMVFVILFIVGIFLLFS
jgi:hypothetical protein